MIRRTVIAAALSIATIACADSSTSPDDLEPARVVVVTGANQTGLAGDELRVPVQIQVVDSRDRAVGGARVRFDVVGAGAAAPVVAFTDETGYASTFWTLGPPDVREQRLSVSVGGRPGLETAVEATAVHPDQADVIIVRGAAGPLRGVLLVQLFQNLDILLHKSVPDTIVRLPPIDWEQVDIVVFSTANRPLLRTTNWTSGIDTVEVTLQPPVAIDYTYTVRAGDFATQLQVISAHREAMRSIWDQAGAGIVEGEVTVIDATGSGVFVDIIPSGVCDRTLPSPNVLVTYASTVNSSPFAGHGCLTGNLFMGEQTGRYPYLLAHEMGHAFSLGHAAGLMNPAPPGTYLSDGQIFRAHFDQRSILNTIFGSQPVSQRRLCADRPRDSVCLAEDFDLDPIAPDAGSAGDA